MEHAEAVNKQATERYLLGQMAEEESEAFELHLFECAECAQDLEQASLFVENARAVLAEPEIRRESVWAKLRRIFSEPLFAAPALATLALAGVTTYQAGVIAQLRQPQAILAFAVKSAARSAADEIRIPDDARYFTLSMDLPDGSFPRYQCDLYATAGALRFTVESSAPAPGTPLNILIPARTLEPGPYMLRVRGLQGSQVSLEIAQYSFVLKKGSGGDD
jgi:hypothetical protein